jgi:hypothetical protein
MTVGVADIAERALRRLGVAVVPVANRPPLAVTIPVATIATNALLWLAVIASDSLVSQAFVSWTSGAIPQAMSEEYTLLTAMHLATAFGKTADPAMLPALEGRIRKYQIVLDAPGAAENAVMDVHNDLSMRGLVRWSSWDIPDSAADAYEMLAANQIAQLFGMPDDEKAGRASEIQLARMIALPTSGERTPAEYF